MFKSLSHTLPTIVYRSRSRQAHIHISGPGSCWPPGTIRLVLPKPEIKIHERLRLRIIAIMKILEVRHIINTFYHWIYLDFPSFEDGLRAHGVEWHQIEIHQIDVAAVGMIDGLKILQWQNRFWITILHKFTYKDLQISINKYCTYQQRCIDAPMKGRYWMSFQIFLDLWFVT